MTQVIGDILPVALVVALSPLPIVAVILMLLAPRAKATSVAFLLGWLVGIGVVISVVTWVAGSTLGAGGSGPSLIGSIIKIILGALALLLALRQWQGRPQPGAEPELPKWMAAIDSVTAAKAFGLGALLSGVNPKNLTLCLAGGVTIGSAGLSAGEDAVAIIIFVLLGSCTVAVPVLGYLIAGNRLQNTLDATRKWLTLHNSAVMTIMLLVIGVTIIGKGIAGL